MPREQMPWMYVKREGGWALLRKVRSEAEQAPGHEAISVAKPRRGRKPRPRWV